MTEHQGKRIYTIKVPDMNCQHCQEKITAALQQMPEIRSLSIDLTSREVLVESALDREVIVQRIKQEGYRPQ